MMRVHYAGGSVITSDEICGALLDYALALSRSFAADIVTVPIVQEEDLKQSTATLFLGTTSQFLAVAVDAQGVTDPIGHEFVDELHRRTIELLAAEADHPAR